MTAKLHPRTMIWVGTEGEKPDPFRYFEDADEYAKGYDLDSNGDYQIESDGYAKTDGKTTTSWTDYPVYPLIYDDNGDGANTPTEGWPLDYTYEFDYTSLVHNYDPTGKLCAIYQKFVPTGSNTDPEAVWHKVSGDIVEWAQKAHEFYKGETGRTDFTG